MRRHDEEQGEEQPAAVNNARANQPAAVTKENRRKRPAEGGSKRSQLTKDDQLIFPRSGRKTTELNGIKKIFPRARIWQSLTADANPSSLWQSLEMEYFQRKRILIEIAASIVNRISA
jgi:hypothetical protein